MVWIVGMSRIQGKGPLRPVGRILGLEKGHRVIEGSIKSNNKLDLTLIALLPGTV